MKKSILGFLALIISFTSCLKAQDNVKAVELRFQQLLLGSSEIDYDNEYIALRYNSIIEQAEKAKALHDKGLKNLDERNGRTKAWKSVLLPLILSYHLSGPADNSNPNFQSADVEKIIIDIFNVVYESGWNQNQDLGYKTIGYEETGIIGLGGSYGNRLGAYGASVFLAKDLLADAGILERELLTLDHATEVLGPNYDTPVFWEVSGLNTDMVVGLWQVRLCYVLSLPSGEEREKQMNYTRRVADKALTIADGFADFLKVDFTTNHHKNPYMSSYGNEGLQGAASMVYTLANTPYELKAQSVGNVAQALLAARIYTNKYDLHPGVSGRAGIYNKPVYLTTSMAEVASIDSKYSKELHGAFLRYWDPKSKTFQSFTKKVEAAKGYHQTLGAMEIAVNQLNKGGVPEPAPNGHWYFNYAGMSVHRVGEWAAIWKGLGKYWWDYEGPAKKNENIYGKYLGAGALHILNGGDPVSAKKSGLFGKGWDWRKIPGTTALEEPIDEVVSKKDRIFASNTFAGGVAIDNDHGMSSMQYRDSRNSMEADKSFFYFGNYIVGLGSSIKSTEERYDMYTTVFQTALSDNSQATYLNGDKWFGELNKTLQQTAFSVTDAAGNAYYSPNPGVFNIERQKQTMPDHTGLKSYSNDYVIGRFIHGQNPTDEHYEYYICVDGGKQGADMLSSQAGELFTIYQKDKNAHIVGYKPNNVVAYALMGANISTGQLIDQTDVPCMAMTKEFAEKEIEIVVMNPEKGLMENTFEYNDIASKETWHAKPIVQPVVLTIKGNWELISDEGAEILSASDELTKISFACLDGIGIKVRLKK